MTEGSKPSYFNSLIALLKILYKLNPYIKLKSMALYLIRPIIVLF
jgi:hypothetical protein